ncbi:uncharacterized protein A4U43_C07F30470 [Asparagus officinalis]|uniref:L-ascorbate oxidase n=1 Tax=Asparagus officinalis TaxID=4686 RepID=A0A5P1EG13_ASPOF|nr:uncharacterized protein A4U43_C07F30470 [Asparagus officinalis]
MKKLSLLLIFLISAAITSADDPYRFFDWTVTYGPISPLGLPQQGILINGQFPGPKLDCVTNDNIIVNVVNNLDEPFLITWNGIKQRKNSWQDGVLGTNCPIPPGANYTYKFQTKDQIGTFTYFPSTAMHRAAGGYGALNVYARPRIPIPYDPPAGDFTLLVGDWFKAGHKVLQQSLDSGSALGFPDGLLINGGQQAGSFTGDQGKTYMFRVSNVGLSVSINFMIQNHQLKLVEVEGSHTIQNTYDSLDIHPGQSATVLVTLDQPSKDYYIIASSRFTSIVLTATAVLHYSNSNLGVFGPVPTSTAGGLDWSMNQASSIRWNLTANAARPNPQGSYHYGTIPRSRSLFLANSAPLIKDKQRYAVNGVSYIVPDTPLKLADRFNIDGVYTYDSIPTDSTRSANVTGTPVVRLGCEDICGVIRISKKAILGALTVFFLLLRLCSYGGGQWSEKMRRRYNLVDALSRHTVQVYPYGWSAILVSLDNQGMWNLRSAVWARQYLGQQFYMRVWTPEQSLANEYMMPDNALLCGKATGLHP